MAYKFNPHTGRLDYYESANLINGVTYSWPALQGSAGTFLMNDGSGVLSWDTPGAGSGSPGGASKQVQFNLAGAFEGAAGFEYQSGASPNVLLQAQAATHTVLILKAAATPSVGLFELQQNDGTKSFTTFNTTAISGSEVEAAIPNAKKLWFVLDNAAPTSATAWIRAVGSREIEIAGNAYVRLNVAGSTLDMKAAGNWTVPNGFGFAIAGGSRIDFNTNANGDLFLHGRNTVQLDVSGANQAPRVIYTFSNSIGDTAIHTIRPKGIGLNIETKLAPLTVKAKANSSATGTTAVTNGVATVTGTSTFFLAEVALGDRITINGETKTVTAIASNTSLTCDSNFAATVSGQTMTIISSIARMEDASGNIGLFMSDGNNLSLGGTLSPLARLHVQGAASGIAQIIQMHATTPGNPWEIQNSAAAKILQVTSAGHFIGNISGSFAIGTFGLASTATPAGGGVAIAIGYNCTASTGANTFAMGHTSSATGNSAFAMGMSSGASGDESIALGGTAAAEKAVSLGRFTLSSGIGAFAIGSRALTQTNGVSAFNTTQTLSTGSQIHIQGLSDTLVSGAYARSMAFLTTAWVTATDASRVSRFIIGTYNVGTQVEAVRFEPTATVFNEAGADIDFRIEGDTDANLFRIDAGDDAILIGQDASSKVAFYGVTAVAQPATIVDADGTLADITTKFNSLLSKLEALGLLAAA